MPSKSLIAIGLLCAARQVLAQPPPPAFGPAASFAVLASTVTSSGLTVVTGNLGGNTITGFPPGTVMLGTTLRHGDIAEPLRDAAAVYEDLRTRTCDHALPSDDLVPKHVYCSSAAPFTVDGTLTLDAHGDANAFWIFQLGNGLTVAPKSAVRVINGGWEGNVFWQVNGQAVIGDGTAFIGNILASKGITFSPGASLSGRALVLGGAATLSGNNVSLCCKLIEVSNPANNTAVANVEFSATFAQTGATAPFTFALASGTLPVGLHLTESGTLFGTTLELGRFPITVRVTDATHCTGTSATYVLHVVCAPITITNPEKDHGIVGVDFEAMFRQTGATEDVFFTASNLPNGLTIEKNGRLHGVPTQMGVFSIVVAVTGANGCSFVSPIIYKLTIDCQAITVTVPTNTIGTAGVRFSEQFGQLGAIGKATYTLASGTLPSALTLSVDGLLSGTTNQTGRFPITVMVTDDNCCTGTSPRFTLIIGCQKITVTNPTNTTGTSGSSFSETFVPTGILGTPVFSYSGTLPMDLKLDPGSGVLFGTPTQTGSFPIIVTVTDSNGCSGSGIRYPLAIGAVPPPSGPSCPSIGLLPPVLPDAFNGVPYMQVLTVTGSGTPPYTFQVTSGTLPSGLNLTPVFPATAASGLVSGIPTVNSDVQVIITVTDANGCKAMQIYSIPALSEWGLIFLVACLGGVGVIAHQTGRRL